MVKDGEPIRLPAPFDNMTVTYPFEWSQPGMLYLFNDKTGHGTLYKPEYARVLAETILAAMKDK